MNSTSAHRALTLLGSVRLPPAVLRTKCSSGMPWDWATIAQLIAGARTSRMLSKRQLVPAVKSATVRPRPQFLSSAVEDFIICAAAQIAISAADTVTKGNMQAMLAVGALLETAKQAEDATSAANEAAKVQANEQKQAQINILTAAIKSLTALLEHELMVWDFAGALVIGLILIDLNNQLARLLQ